MRQSPQTWRELLGSLDEQERKRIVEHLGIQTKTLDRWIRGATDLPRAATLQQLLPLLPNTMRKHFILLLQQDAGFVKYTNGLRLPSLQSEIPSAFYTRILETNASNSGTIRFTAVCQLVAMQLLQLLDADALGLSITILKCSPPAQDGTIQSLRQHFSLGTKPWQTLVDQTSFFLGAESIVARAIHEKSPFVSQDLQSEGVEELLFTHQDEYTRSIAAFCLQRETTLAGALVVASTQPHFFTSSIQALLQQYCNMLVIAMRDDEFYRVQQVNLGRMPSIAHQQDILRRMYRQVGEAVRQAPSQERPERWTVVEREMLQAIEGELLILGTQEQSTQRETRL